VNQPTKSNKKAKTLITLFSAVSCSIGNPAPITLLDQEPDILWIEVGTPTKRLITESETNRIKNQINLMTQGKIKRAT
jgi:hypothetical protein